MTDDDFFRPGDIYTTTVTYHLADGTDFSDKAALLILDSTLAEGFGAYELLAQRATLLADGWMPIGEPWIIHHTPARPWQHGAIEGTITGRDGTYKPRDPDANSIEILADQARQKVRSHADWSEGDMVRLRDLSAQRTGAEQAIRALTVKLATAEGGPAKTRIARAGGISRPTLDAWIAADEAERETP